MKTRKKEAGIYLIKNLANNKVYVGYSEGVKKRIENHKFRLRKGIHSNPHLQNAWFKYGEEYFHFSIIENLPSGLSKQEYESVETKWVLYYNSHMSKYGYNCVLPGSIPLERKEEMNICKVGKSSKRDCICICINKTTLEIIEKSNYDEVAELTSIPRKKVSDYTLYWVNKTGRRKSYKGWIIIKKQNYDPSFDYIHHDNKIKSSIKKTWRDYEKTRKRNKKDN